MRSGCGAVRFFFFFFFFFFRFSWQAQDCVLVGVSRARFAWQAQYLVTPASVLVSLSGPALQAVSRCCGVFPHGVLRSRVLRCGSWLGRAM